MTSNGHVITRQISFAPQRSRTGGKPRSPASAASAAEEGTVPRVSRLLALAIRFEGLLQQGAVADQAELADLSHVSRARLTQIMNLLHMAPDIQEQILFLPRTKRGRDAITEGMLRPIAALPLWSEQRAAWRRLDDGARL